MVEAANSNASCVTFPPIGFRDFVCIMLLKTKFSWVADPQAQQLYARKLQGDALDAWGGSWSSKARAALSVLAESWNSDAADSTQVVDAFLSEFKSDSLLDQIARGRPAEL